MDVKELLLEHFEKLALGVAGLVLVWLVGQPLLASSPSERLQDEVARYNARLAVLKAHAEANAPRPEPIELEREVQRALAGGLPPQPWPSWLMHRRPVVLVRTIGVQLPDPPEHHPPIDLSGRGGLGAIAISWAANPRNRLVAVQNYRVYRAAGKLPREGEPGWTLLATLGPGEHSYRDTAVEPEQQYWYYVESHAVEDRKHPVVEKHEFRLPEEQQRQRSAVIGPFATQPQTYVEIISVQPREVREGRLIEPFAYVKVWRFFDDERRWRDSPLLKVEVGQQVGGVQRVGTREYDFTTPWELVGTRKRIVDRELGPGLQVKEEQDVAELRHRQTGQEIELNNKVRDPVLELIKKNDRYGVEDTGETG
ncbi:MAG: hypothetical protein KatS3mg102_2161 [Planctomycetota bacterium]|nr:MAG: hypothetical protein KatS3mg102_2161 [Planctomycetota bacterium]